MTQLNCFGCRHQKKVEKTEDGFGIKSWFCAARCETVWNNGYTKQAHCWYKK